MRASEGNVSAWPMVGDRKIAPAISPRKDRTRDAAMRASQNTRAFFIRAIARLNYPRLYSRHLNDLRALSTFDFPGVAVGWHSGARSPKRQRVAISRHEFHRRSAIMGWMAFPKSQSEAGRLTVRASASPFAVPSLSSFASIGQRRPRWTPVYVCLLEAA